MAKTRYTDEEKAEYLSLTTDTEILELALKSGLSVESVKRNIRHLKNLEKEGNMSDTAALPDEGAEDDVLAQLDSHTRRFLEQYRPLPEIPKRVLATRIEDMEVGEHQGIALFSDYHYGQKIDPRVSGGLAEYNTKIARERLALWRDGVLRFTQLTQVTAHVDVLNFFALGDEVEGHGAMFETQAFQMTDSVYFQYMEFIEDMTQVLLSFLQRYKKVKVYKVPGNHGRIAQKAKGAYGADNLELMAWQHIKDRLLAIAPDRFEFHIETSFFSLVNIYGWIFYLRHGHKVGGLGQTYTGADTNKLRMNAIIGRPIHYMVKGHLHEAASKEGELDGEVIQNGSFIGPSLLSVEGNRASANRPSQEFFMVHKRGITHRHRIHLATAEEFRKFKVHGE